MHRRSSRMVPKAALTAFAALAAFAAAFGWAGPAHAEFPTLERSIQLAKEHAVIVAEATGEVGVARAQMAGAKQSILGNPSLDVQIDQGIGGQQSPGSTQQLQALGYMYFPLDIGGQRGARVEEADKLIKWRELGLQGAKIVATGEAVAVYGEVLLGHARVSFATQGEQDAKDEAKYFAGRLSAKDTTVYETSLAEAEVARWVQQKAEATLRLASARARYAQLTGIADFDAPPPNPSPAPPSLRGPWDDAYIARLVDKAPIIARLTAEKTYWESSVERYKTERFPPFTLELIGGRGSAGEARLGGGFIVAFPVTRRNQGEIARAESSRNTAVAQLALYRNVIQSRLRAARDAYVAVDKCVKELDAVGMPALEKAVSASNEAFKLGKIDQNRMLLARRDLALARARQLDLLEAAWRAYADLAIIGGDLP